MRRVEKLRDVYKEVVWVTEERRANIKDMIDGFVQQRHIDVVVMGSIALSPRSGKVLGSVTQGVAQMSSAHVCVVKNMPFTW